MSTGRQILDALGRVVLRHGGRVGLERGINSDPCCDCPCHCERCTSAGLDCVPSKMYLAFAICYCYCMEPQNPDFGWAKLNPNSRFNHSPIIMGGSEDPCNGVANSFSMQYLVHNTDRDYLCCPTTEDPNFSTFWGYAGQWPTCFNGDVPDYITPGTFWSYRGVYANAKAIIRFTSPNTVRIVLLGTIDGWYCFGYRTYSASFGKYIWFDGTISIPSGFGDNCAGDMVVPNSLGTCESQYDFEGETYQVAGWGGNAYIRSVDQQVEPAPCLGYVGHCSPCPQEEQYGPCGMDTPNSWTAVASGIQTLACIPFTPYYGTYHSYSFDAGPDGEGPAVPVDFNYSLCLPYKGYTTDGYGNQGFGPTLKYGYYDTACAGTPPAYGTYADGPSYYRLWWAAGIWRLEAWMRVGGLYGDEHYLIIFRGMISGSWSCPQVLQFTNLITNWTTDANTDFLPGVSAGWNFDHSVAYGKYGRITLIHCC